MATTAAAQKSTGRPLILTETIQRKPAANAVVDEYARKTGGQGAPFLRASTTCSRNRETPTALAMPSKMRTRTSGRMGFKKRVAAA